MMSNELKNDPSEEIVVQVEKKKKKKKVPIKWKEMQNVLIGFMLLFFFFFGFLCNSGNSARQQDPENKLLFIYTAFISTDTLEPLGLYLPAFLDWVEMIPLWTSIFIFFGIGVYQAKREDFLVFSIKNNIIMIPIIIVLSWI